MKGLAKQKIMPAMSELPKNILQAVTAANDRIEESVRHADGSTTYYLKTRFREYHQIVNHYEKKHKTPKVHMRMEEVDAANGCKTEGWRVSIEVIPADLCDFLLPDIVVQIAFATGNLQDIQNFRCTCKFIRSCFSPLPRWVMAGWIKERLQERTDHTENILQAMKSSKGVMAGAFPLQCVLGQRWKGSDMDFFVSMVNNSDLDVASKQLLERQSPPLCTTIGSLFAPVELLFGESYNPFGESYNATSKWMHLSQHQCKKGDLETVLQIVKLAPDGRGLSQQIDSIWPIHNCTVQYDGSRVTCNNWLALLENRFYDTNKFCNSWQQEHPKMDPMKRRNIRDSGFWIDSLVQMSVCLWDGSMT